MLGMELLHVGVTEEIIGAAFRVHNVLGGGHREVVYQRGLAKELQARGLAVEEQFPVPVDYLGETIAETRVDFCVNKLVLVELKAADCFRAQDFRQLNGYLIASGLQIGLLIVFAKDIVKIKRVANIVPNP